jgi:hypothetical protein
MGCRRAAGIVARAEPGGFSVSKVMRTQAPFHGLGPGGATGISSAAVPRSSIVGVRLLSFRFVHIVGQVCIGHNPSPKQYEKICQ